MNLQHENERFFLQVKSVIPIRGDKQNGFSAVVFKWSG